MVKRTSINNSHNQIEVINNLTTVRPQNQLMLCRFFFFLFYEYERTLQGIMTQLEHLQANVLDSMHMTQVCMKAGYSEVNAS